MTDIQKTFYKFHDKIIIPAIEEEHFVLKNNLHVRMKITLQQFREWLEQEQVPSDILINTRQYWNCFVKYVKRKINYGYYFDNIDIIDRFLPDIQPFVLSKVDSILNKYIDECNIDAAGIVYRFKEENDHFTFDLIAPLFKDDFKEKEEHINIFKDGRTDAKTQKEENEELMKNFELTGVAYNQIGKLIIDKKITDSPLEEFFLSFELNPKVISHLSEQNKISFKFSISKRSFIENFSLYRKDDPAKAWETFKQDFINHKEKYLTINKPTLGSYMNQHHININQFIDIHDIDTTNDRSIKFWIDAQ